MSDGRAERGATTIEYTMVLGLMGAISIFASLGLIGALLDMMARLAVQMSLFLTSPPS